MPRLIPLACTQRPATSLFDRGGDEKKNGAQASISILTYAWPLPLNMALLGCGLLFLGGWKCPRRCFACLGGFDRGPAHGNRFSNHALGHPLSNRVQSSLTCQQHSEWPEILIQVLFEAVRAFESSSPPVEVKFSSCIISIRPDHQFPTLWRKIASLGSTMADLDILSSMQVRIRCTAWSITASLMGLVAPT